MDKLVLLSCLLLTVCAVLVAIWAFFGDRLEEPPKHEFTVIRTDFVVDGQVVGSVQGLGRCKCDDDTVVVHRIYYAED
jgi:hypothetical protein